MDKHVTFTAHTPYMPGYTRKMTIRKSSIAALEMHVATDPADNRYCVQIEGVNGWLSISPDTYRDLLKVLNATT